MSAEPGTSWKVTVSEGLDAIAFLGPLSGVSLYLDEYRSETADFSPRLAPSVINRIRELAADASSSGFGLMWPNLANVLSLGPTDSLDDVIDSTGHLDDTILSHRPELASWSDSDWSWLISFAPELHRILVALRDAEFSEFRHGLLGDTFAMRADELTSQLAPFDVVGLDSRLSGKDLAPEIEIVLSYFCRPHGVRIQGQRFIQSPDYDLMTTVRVAAHELLHPPMDMTGPLAMGILAVLEKDEVLTRLVREHDPSWGYTTLEGILNEDICQAIDQLVVEQLSMARNPADRWHDSDGGIHVLAAGVYGMLRDDGWVRHGGGSIEVWLAGALATGRLEPPALHAVAARVLERPIDRLWPLT